MTSSIFSAYDASSDPNGISLTGSLLGAASGITIVPGSFSLQASAPEAISFYDGSLSLGIGAGLLLTSGTIPGTTNTVSWFGQDNTRYAADGTPINFYNGNASIDAVVNTVFQTQSFDATTIGFSFTTSDPTKTSISFDIVFGSDEFPEWVDQFVDCAVVIVNGVNYALFNHDAKAPLSVIGSNLSAGYFQDNAGNALPIEYDGVSHVLKIVAPINPGQVNSIMIGIADTGDHIYDSGIFIANLTAGTTPGSGVVITPGVPCTEGADVVTGSVADELIKLLGGDDTAYAGGGDDIVVAGAGNDVVYGGSGNDVLEGDAGDDTLDGGEGNANTAVYIGKSADYTFAYSAATGTYTVTGPEGTDTLRSIQLVQFKDGLFDLEPTGLAPHIADAATSSNLAGSVVLSGMAMVGQTLTATAIDGDGVPKGQVAYDWLTSSDGSTWISTGITTQTYTLVDGDAGRSIKASASYVDLAGQGEAPTSASLVVAAHQKLAMALVHVSAPTGAGVENPLTTLLANAMLLGLSANQASVAIKSVLGLPDINLLTYDPIAKLGANALDATALNVLKVCGELAMAASVSDPSAINLTLAVIDAAAKNQTINLTDKTQLATLLGDVGATALGIVQTTNKDMGDAKTVSTVMAAWNDFCGHLDPMAQYMNNFGSFNIHVNLAPVGSSTASLPGGVAGLPYTIDAKALLAGFSDPNGDALHVTSITADIAGSMTQNADGSWTFVPNATFTGPVELSFILSDPSGATTTGNAMFVIGTQNADTVAPTVKSLAYGANDGTLKAGETVSLLVGLSEAVTVAGAAAIALANGGTATYVGGSGTNTLTFSYTVKAGQDAGDLATAGTGALAGNIADAAGNAVTAAGFNGVNPAGTLIIDTIAPAIGSFSPVDGATGIAVGANMILGFGEPVARGTGSITLRQGSATGTIVESFDAATSSRLTLSGSTLTIDPTNNLANGTTYFLVFGAGTLLDAAGNGNSVISSYDFTTVPAGNLIMGTAGTDTLAGTSGVDVIYGLGGNDVLTGAAGTDVLDGGDGSDLYIVAASSDHAAAEFADTGATGTDEVRFTATTAATLTLYAGDTGIEKIVIGTGTGTAAVTTATTANSINAAALGYGIALVGNAGANTLTGGIGNDTLTGNAGVDSFIVIGGTDVITDLGNGGADILNVSAGATANASIMSAWTASSTTINKGTVNITTAGLAVNLAAVTATTAGNIGYHITDTGGATTLTGSSLGDWLTGGSGADVLVGGPGTDVLNGGDGSDIYLVSLAADHVAAEFADSGLSGTDEVRFTATTASTLTLYAGDSGIEKAVIGTGTAATAVTTGTTANNINASALAYGISLVGNAGANTLTGGTGNDTLSGGAGKDTLTGGAGADIFSFDSTPNTTSNLDTVTDFLSGTDRLQFSKAVFAGLTLGNLGVDAFWSGAGVSAAHDATDRLIYNTTTGVLYYDADGTGGASAAVQVAILGTTSHPMLSYLDCVVVG